VTVIEIKVAARALDHHIKSFEKKAINGDPF
jgi:hypothetical protein